MLMVFGKAMKITSLCIIVSSLFAACMKADISKNQEAHTSNSQISLSTETLQISTSNDKVTPYYPTPTLQVNSSNSQETLYYPTPTTTLEEYSDIITLVFGGDVMTQRDSSHYINPSLEESFSNIIDIIAEADISVINLETPICDISGHENDGDYAPFGEYVFRAELGTGQILEDIGIYIVSLANNHTMNRNFGCLEDTFTELSNASVIYVGAGYDLESARALKVFDVNSIKIGFLAYADVRFSNILIAGEAGEEKKRSDGGFSYTGYVPMNIDYLIEDLEKAQEDVDFIIVSMHSGFEYTPLPNQVQEEFARTAIEYGANLVIGHHPHVIQPVEIIDGNYIFYSLGNLIFDISKPEEVRHNLLVEVNIEGGEVINVNYHPLYSRETQIPELAPENIAREIMERLAVEINE